MLSLDVVADYDSHVLPIDPLKRGKWWQVRKPTGVWSLWVTIDPFKKSGALQEVNMECAEALQLPQRLGRDVSTELVLF